MVFDRLAEFSTAKAVDLLDEVVPAYRVGVNDHFVAKSPGCPALRE